VKPTRPLIVILLITAAHYFHHQLTALVVPLLPFMRDGFGLTYTQAGGLVSAFALSYGIGQLPAGWLADRIGPRYLMLAGISGVAVAGVLVGLSQTYLALVLFLILMGIMGGGYHPSATPIISMAVPPRQRGRAVGIHLVGGSASHLVAPLLGVAIAGVLGWRGSFLVIAAPVFVLGLVVFVLFGRLSFAPEAGISTAVPAPGTPGVPQAPGTVGPDGRVSRGAPETGVSSRRVAFFLAMTGVMGAFIASIVAFLPLFLVDVLGANESVAAFALALFFSAGFWAAPIGGMLADRFGPPIVFAAVAVSVGPVIVLLGLSGGVVAATIMLLLLGGVMFVRMTVSESFLVDAVSPARRSTVLGIYFFAGMEGSGIITPLLGNLIDRFGFRFAFTTTGVATMVLLAVLAGASAWFNRPREDGATADHAAAPVAEDVRG
jgi:MFS transporter, FSR family, fosmidomycin resistance protein